MKTVATWLWEKRGKILAGVAFIFIIVMFRSWSENYRHNSQMAELQYRECKLSGKTFQDMIVEVTPIARPETRTMLARIDFMATTQEGRIFLVKDIDKIRLGKPVNLQYDCNGRLVSHTMVDNPAS